MTTTADRNLSTFAHGIHPPDSKSFSADVPVEILPTPSEVQISLLQHLGATCQSTVKPRTDVKVGDQLGSTDAFVSAPVHASIAGTTAREAMATLPNGRHVPAVPIKAADEQPLEGQALWDDIFGGDWPTDPTSKKPEEIVAATKAAGLVGLGGAAFPTHIKLSPPKDKEISTLLVNGCECEPYLTADYRLMVEAPAPIVSGALLAARAVGASRVVIAIEDNKPAAIEAMRKAAESTDVEIQPVQTKYPQGGEKQLIVATLGLEVPTGGLPLEVGVVVVNVATAASLARAVYRGKPLTHRIVSVSGGGIAQSKNLLVPIGTSYQTLIDYCGGLTEDAVRVVAGGPMMGFTFSRLDAPVTKGTSGITILTEREIVPVEETPCLRCGRCVTACPMRLIPQRLALATRAGNPELANDYYINSCMECGCCAYVCPARLPLVQLIRLGKVMAKEAK